MKQFCKLCIITAFYLVFWIPDAFHLSWNLIQPINDSYLYLSNILYFIPYVLTPLLGLFVKKEEGLLVFLGGVLASLCQFIIASADSLTSFLNYWNQPFTYFPYLFKMFIQLIYIGIIIILTSKVADRFKTPNDQDAEDDIKELHNEEMIAEAN